jgi:hypothetical protein
MKVLLLRESLLSLLFACSILPLRADITYLETRVKTTSGEIITEPSAIILQAKGKCEYSENGGPFKKLQPKQVLTQGVVLRTGSNGRVDMFIQKTGGAIRVQANTEIELSKIRRTGNAVNALIDLRKGTIFSMVHTKVAGATLDIVNTTGASTVQELGASRFVVSAGAKANAAAKKTSQTKEAEKFVEAIRDPVQVLVEFDELDNLAETWVAETASIRR